MPPKRKSMKDLENELKAVRAAKEVERLAKVAADKEAKEVMLAKAAAAREAREVERLAKTAADKEAKEAEEQHPESPTAGKGNKKSKNKSKTAGPLALGDATYVESETSTPVANVLWGVPLAPPKSERGAAPAKVSWGAPVAPESEWGGAPPKAAAGAAPAKVSWGATVTSAKSEWGAAALPKAAAMAAPENGAMGAGAPQSLAGVTGVEVGNTGKGKADKTEKSTGEDAWGLDETPGAEDAKGLQAKQLAEKVLEDEEAKKLEDERVAKWQEEVTAKEKEQRELAIAAKQAEERALQDERQKKLEEAKRAKEEAEKSKRENEEAEKVRQEERREKELVEKTKKAQEQRETEARSKTEEAAKMAENERRRRQEEEADKVKKTKELEELQIRRAQAQLDAEAKERNRILLSTPVITSVSPRQRSPSLESISSLTSAFSSNDNPGTTSRLSSPTISAQGASQSVANFFIQGEQEDGLHERERIKKTASPRDNEQLKSGEASQALTDAYPMHKRFCFPAENIYFLVEGVLYSVHRYFFERDSSSFAGQGLSKQEPMVLANISTHDFDLFLSILYPTSFGVYPASTVEEWSGILHLADKWSFQSIRALAIAQIAPIASPIDKIVFGRLYGINEWLTSAYHAVCTRPDALTLEEGRRLGVDDVIRINAIRQDFCFVRVSESSPKLFEEDVKSRFGLAAQMEHSVSRKSMKDVVDRLKPDKAAEATARKEEAARAAEIQRKKREQEAADKKLKDLEVMQREAEVKSKEAAKAVEIERKKVEQQQQARKQAKDLEDKRAPSAGAADSTPIESSKKNTGRAKPAAAISGISTTLIGIAASEEEDWSHLTPDARFRKKWAKIEKEKADEQRAEFVNQMKQQLADEANAAQGGATQQGAGGTSVSNTLMGTAANGKDDWSHLTPSQRYSKKYSKLLKELDDEEHAERLKEARQQMADEAKAAEETAAQQGPGSCVDGPIPHVCG